MPEPGAAANKQFVVRGVTLPAFHDERIDRQTDYWDARAALRQLEGLAWIGHFVP